jgi:hypothetical protein
MESKAQIVITAVDRATAVMNRINEHTQALAAPLKNALGRGPGWNDPRLRIGIGVFSDSPLRPGPVVLGAGFTRTLPPA